MTQGQFTSSSCCVKYSIWLRIGSAFWLLGPQGQLSHKAHVRSEQFCTALITYPQAAAQTRRICLAFEVTDPCCFRATDKVVASSGSRDQDPTMVPGSISEYSHQHVPHYPQVPSPASHHSDHIFQFSFSFPFLHHLLALLSGAWDL